MPSIEVPRHPRTSSLTYKGQVTIPVEIRRQMGLKRGDKVAFVQEGETVTLRPAQSVTERTSGVLAQYRKHPAPTPQEEREAFAQAVADQVAESLDA